MVRTSSAVAVPAAIEPLEARQFLSVSTNAAGFTVITPAADSRLVYVSSTGGSDGNSGLSPSSPVKSLARATALVRSGMPDQLLLKRGDQWSESFGYWKKSGRSASEPLVIGAYGTGARPEVRSGTGTALYVGNIANREIHALSILGVNFHANGRDTSAGGSLSSSSANGVAVISATHDLRIEDCTFEKYQVGISFVPVYGDSVGTTVRRCIVTDSYTTSGGGAHGLFADGVRGLTLDQNVFDHNGWLDGVASAKPTIYNHNVYITANSSGLVAKGNVFANASSHGLQARSGGIITGNLFLNDPIGLSFGVVNGSGVNVKGGVSGRIEGNVFLGGRDISGQMRGMCIEIGNIRAGGGTVVRDNVMSQDYAGSQLWAMSLEYGTGTYQADAVGINDLTIEKNVVYKWYKGLFLQYGLSPSASGYQHLGNVTVRNNDFVEITSTVYINAKDLHIDSIAEGLRSVKLSTGGWVNPDRNVATYMASILGGTRSAGDFLQARPQPRRRVVGHAFHSRSSCELRASGVRARGICSLVVRLRSHSQGCRQSLRGFAPYVACHSDDETSCELLLTSQGLSRHRNDKLRDGPRGAAHRPGVNSGLQLNSAPGYPRRIRRALHIPVLLKPVLDVLAPKPGQVFVDCTLGLGGHTAAILERVAPNGRLIGIDFDPANIAAARERLTAVAARTGGSFELFHNNFAALPTVLAQAGVERVDGILADIGVASTQIDDPARGFSYRRPGPLDMRMDPTRGQPASALINRLSEKELAEALLELGDETDAAQIAKLIVESRKAEPITTTERLTAIVCKARDFTLARAAGAKLHPAARTFQALRILVNRELANLDRLLAVLAAYLRPGGAAAIITFHSGEDRRVKDAFKAGLAAGAYAAVSREPIVADETEKRHNPRARSAKLRWARMPS